MKKKGSMAVEMLLVIYIIIIIFFTFLSILPVFIYKQKLDNYGRNLIRVAEIKSTSNLSSEINKLNSIYNINPIVKFNKNGSYRLNEEIILELEIKYLYKMIWYSQNVEIKSKLIGRCEGYAK